MKTTRPSRRPVRTDKFHFTYNTAAWTPSQGGTEAGYGAEFAILAGQPPRRTVVAFTEAGSPAASLFARGDEILFVDGADAVAQHECHRQYLNAGLFLETTNEATRSSCGTPRTQRTVVITSTNACARACRHDAPGSGPVGYIQFNDHIATAEALITAVNTLKNQNVTDLILDLRYNGGYLISRASWPYMIATPR
jgi:C-terminal processing protease CtpA/Prc